MSRGRILALVLAIGVATVAAEANPISHVYPLGDSGWTVTGPSFYELVVVVDGEGIDSDGVPFVAIEISKKFRFGPDPDTGVFPSITLDFSQTKPDAETAARIYLADETVTNLTGAEWQDFHWVLFRHGTAQFNQDKTNVTTDVNENGWLIAPFTEHEWTVNDASDTEELSVWGGSVPADGVFFPGNGSGNLVIDLELTGPDPASFTFKQIPTPEPTVLCLLAAGGAGLLARRKRA